MEDSPEKNDTIATSRAEAASRVDFDKNVFPYVAGRHVFFDISTCFQHGSDVDSGTLDLTMATDTEISIRSITSKAQIFGGIPIVGHGKDFTHTPQPP